MSGISKYNYKICEGCLTVNTITVNNVFKPAVSFLKPRAKKKWRWSFNGEGSFCVIAVSTHPLIWVWVAEAAAEAENLRPPSVQLPPLRRPSPHVESMPFIFSLQRDLSATLATSRQSWGGKMICITCFGLFAFFAGSGHVCKEPTSPYQNWCCHLADENSSIFLVL